MSSAQCIFIFETHRLWQQSTFEYIGCAKVIGKKLHELRKLALYFRVGILEAMLSQSTEVLIEFDLERADATSQPQPICDNKFACKVFHFFLWIIITFGFVVSIVTTTLPLVW